MTKLRTAAVALLSASQVTNAAYNLVKDYSGQTFFDNWSYYGSFDNLTNGDIIWVDSATGSAPANPLTYINPAGNAVIKVDNTTTVPYNEKRNSVRLTSNDKIGLGTLVTFDALHVPYGCSTWGALWTKAVGDLWPAGGEIDIFEGVNLQTVNQMALHTVSGCTQAEGITQTGTTNVRSCDGNSSSGAGCTVVDPSTNSYGAPFAAAGGGMWVTEFATTGVNIWFFSRANIPSSLSGSPSSVDVSTLGTPTGSWPASSCNPAQFFKEQELVIDITLCGDWAGVKSILEATCPALTGTNTCYTTYVLDPANYATAYFELASVKIFATDPSAVSTAANTPTSTASGGSGASGTSRPNAGSRSSVNVLLGSMVLALGGAVMGL
ncbi:glycoside hydrolase family 16 protein [Serendipita vermifera MAFF 305830]|uniref:Glycoside hydrolase family 16 protein n=1 Tax=Serendipita vermifera MAFF 305830 TaxID=933852 RepID=A0A0C3ALA9_SERVB|nr:glycoside hydrolase family 16 protein [Serendipita vermifera MAFF 305830]